MKKTTTWAVLGSLAINLLLGGALALVFSAVPAAQAAELPPAPASTPAAPPKAPATGEAAKPDYLTAVRMGWAAG
jgi:hypothetical protein